jgi:hypothetical protein
MNWSISGLEISFGNGIVRIHSENKMLRARNLIEVAFPEYGDGVVPIAKDLMGRQISVLFASATNLFGRLLLIEPGSGEAFQIDCGIEELSDVKLIAEPVNYLSFDLFKECKKRNPRISSSGQCVGFKVALFLGGSGSVDNVEVGDEQVYWSVFGQLRAKVKGLSPGSKIGGAQID